MPQLGWTARPDGFIDYYNLGWYEFTGSTPEEMEGWGWTSVHHPGLLPAIVAQWKHSIATGKPFEATFQLRRHDGVFRWFLTRANPMRDPDGRIVRWVGINTDIDDQKRAEAVAAVANLRSDDEARERLEDAVRVRGDLLAMVSHDLRNPLNIVSMAAKQLELLGDDSGVGARCKKAASVILKSVERMTRLVSDLLDLSKLEAGQALPLDLARHDMLDLLREAVELLEPVAVAKHLSLTLDTSAATYVLCDGDRVQQVLFNLIGNAMKFTREGGSIRVQCRAAAGEFIVSVNDTGIGIPVDALAYIFEAYWQSDPQRKRGAGLGLSISKAIIDAHGGHIWVESEVGAGSAFHFSLPGADTLPAEEER